MDVREPETPETEEDITAREERAVVRGWLRLAQDLLRQRRAPSKQTGGKAEDEIDEPSEEGDQPA